MAKPTVILIGADKGGVGKTTVAHTLVDYLTAQGIPLRAFDTEAPKGALYRFHPKITEIVDVTEVPGQMRIFDSRSQTSPSLTCAPGSCRRRCTPCAISSLSIQPRRDNSLSLSFISSAPL
jgi:MinD superfamily P-loop ATPase